MDYKYSPLQQSSSIRVLLVNGSTQKDAPLICSLREVSLDKPPAYRALSYAWSGQPLDRPIQCDGKRLLVSATCESALKRLRPTRPRRKLMIWVDAICIHQSAGDEKNIQVAMMDQIYRKAEAVCAWLGESTPASERWFRDVHKARKHQKLGLNLITPHVRQFSLCHLEYETSK
jgi:Heterokaryon incompatibility protein (HET)